MPEMRETSRTHLLMNLQDKAMRSLIDAYIKCGGDPNDLVTIFKPEPPSLPEGEAEFFKRYEDDLNA